MLVPYSIYISPRDVGEAKIKKISPLQRDFVRCVCAPSKAMQMCLRGVVRCPRGGRNLSVQKGDSISAVQTRYVLSLWRNTLLDECI